VILYGGSEKSGLNAHPSTSPRTVRSHEPIHSSHAQYWECIPVSCSIGP
jgi:hypothetical protein